MEKRYFLHRISHEGNVSYSLIDEGYLTLGWSLFADSDILDAAREEGYGRFNPIAESFGVGQNRSRWSMWYFAQMRAGDIVVVPLYGGNFSVFQVLEAAQSISNLEKLVPNINAAWDNHKIVWRDHRIYDESINRMIDLGFFVKVERIGDVIPRNYVTGKLVSRMKIQMTNADITDIKEHVDIAINVCKSKKSVSLYEKSMEQLAETLKKQIIDVLDDVRFERLVKWYMEKSGAEYSKISAKNEPGKKNGADADIIAEYKNLKHIVYIQAKHHKGETSDWAVHQIKEYFSQKSDGDPDYSYAKWVISTCETFSEQAIKASKEYSVRLINGEEFARMLIDAGLLNLDDAFENER